MDTGIVFAIEFGSWIAYSYIGSAVPPRSPGYWPVHNTYVVSFKFVPMNEGTALN